MRVAESNSATDVNVFNGMLQWGRNMRVAESSTACQFISTRRASMGPQHESCGKKKKRKRVFPLKKLQWGRNMRVAESRRSRTAVPSTECFNGAAT